MTVALETTDPTKAATVRRLLRLGYEDREIATAVDTPTQYVRNLRRRSESGELYPRHVARRMRRQERFLQVLRQSNGLIKAAVKAMGINETTPYTWMQADPEFAAAVDEIRETAIDHVESKLFDKIDGGDTTAITFFLKTRAKHRGYSESLALTGDNGGPVLVRVIEPYADPLADTPEIQHPSEQPVEAVEAVDVEYVVIEPEPET